MVERERGTSTIGFTRCSRLGSSPAACDAGYASRRISNLLEWLRPKMVSSARPRETHPLDGAVWVQSLKCCAEPYRV